VNIALSCIQGMSTLTVRMPEVPRISGHAHGRLGDGGPRTRELPARSGRHKKLKRLRGVNLSETNARIVALLKVDKYYLYLVF